MNWNELNEPWRKAFLLGWKSFCNGSIPIGAVITDKDDKIISYGRNKINESTIPNFKTAHAEIEAVQKLDISIYPDVKTYTLYACMEPCPMCLGTIVMGNLHKIRVAAKDAYGGALELCQKSNYIKSKRIEIEQDNNILGNVQITMQTYFELKNNSNGCHDIIAKFEQDYPKAVKLATDFFSEGYLDNCNSKNVPFSEIFDDICKKL